MMFIYNYLLIHHSLTNCVYVLLSIYHMCTCVNISMSLSQEEKDLDINKAFEDLLFAEEIAQKSGYKEGYKSGKEQLLKGYHLGYHRASIIAAQLGYYSGVLEHYLQNNDTGCEKTIMIAKTLLKDIHSTLPDHQDDNLDILKALENIKCKYAKFCSLAKINSVYPEADKLEF